MHDLLSKAEEQRPLDELHSIVSTFPKKPKRVKKKERERGKRNTTEDLTWTL